MIDNSGVANLHFKAVPKICIFRLQLVCFDFNLKILLNLKSECFWECPKLLWALFQALASKKNEENQCHRFDWPAELENFRLKNFRS